MDQRYQNASLAGQAEPRPMPEGESIAMMLSDRVDNLAVLVQRVRHFADRLSGGVPSAVNGNAQSNGPSPATPPINSRLRSTNDSFCSLLKDLSDEVNRLEAFA